MTKKSEHGTEKRTKVTQGMSEDRRMKKRWGRRNRNLSDGEDEGGGGELKSSETRLA